MGERRARAALDAAALREVADRACSALARARDDIDRSNVFPIADGDTGSNLLATMRAARAGLDGDAGTGTGAVAETASVAAVAARLARGALLGARGNAGTLLSQVLAGWASALDGRIDAGVSEMQAAFRLAARAVREALGQPVEGTLLTVAEAAADGADGATTSTLAELVSAARRAAEQALARTPQQLPVLAAAGVVDAGGAGLVIVLRALEDVVRGVADDHPPPQAAETSATGAMPAEEAGPAYEVMYLLDASGDDVTALRTALQALGDSLVVTGGAGDLWHVHVHTDDIGAAIEAAVEAGRPHRIRVTPLPGRQPSTGDDCRPAPAPSREGRAVVAVVPAGLASLVTDAGAVPVVDDPPPDAQLLVQAAGARVAECLLLASDAEAARRAAAQLGDRDVHVETVAAGCAVQVLAALAVSDPASTLSEEAAAMRGAAGAVRCLELERVSDPAEAVRSLDEILAGGAELVTVIAGKDVDGAVLAAVEEHLASGWPGVELSSYEAGPAVHIGVER